MRTLTYAPLVLLALAVVLSAWAGIKTRRAHETSRRAAGAFADVRGLRLYYETYGPEGAPPLLLLHGGASQIEALDAVIASLSRTFRVIAPEQVGHGRTADARVAYAYDDMAEDTVALLEALGVREPVHCVGWSDGGILCLDIAMHHPERVFAMAISGASFRPDGLTDRAVAWNRTARGADLLPRAPAIGDKILTMWRTQPQWTKDDLARVRAPTLVLAGEHDVVREDHTRALAAALTHGEVKIVPGASHDLPKEQPDVFTAAVRTFFARQ
jgi:pimeloyl-ACP methyl ester carboxylesterase